MTEGGKKSGKRYMRSLSYVKYVERRKTYNFKRYLIILTALTTLVVSLTLYQLQFGSCEFWAAYERNFNRLVYGNQHYCNLKINSDLIGEKLLEQIVGQEYAIKLIRGSLNLANGNGYIQMIFHGSTGNGKTLASEIIANNFINPKNVQKYIWNIDDTSNLFDMTESPLSKCGFNLIIIDDLDISNESKNFLESFENAIRDNLVIRNNYKIVLIAIFKNELTEVMKLDLAEFVIIDFEPITFDIFLKCIDIHQKLFNIKEITAQEFEELKEINYNSSGCKLLSKKLTAIK